MLCRYSILLMTFLMVPLAAATAADDWGLPDLSCRGVVRVPAVDYDRREYVVEVEVDWHLVSSTLGLTNGPAPPSVRVRESGSAADLPVANRSGIQTPTSVIELRPHAPDGAFPIAGKARLIHVSRFRQRANLGKSSRPETSDLQRIGLAVELDVYNPRCARCVNTESCEVLVRFGRVETRQDFKRIALEALGLPGNLGAFVSKTCPGETQNGNSWNGQQCVSHGNMVL